MYLPQPQPWLVTGWVCLYWTGLKVGDPIAELAYGAFSEWGVVRTKHALPVPVLAPEVVALLTSGLTASIGTHLPCPEPACVQLHGRQRRPL